MLTWIALSAHISIDVISAYAARLFSFASQSNGCMYRQKNASTFIIDEHFCLALVECFTDVNINILNF